MKKATITYTTVLAICTAALLTGCGKDKPSESSSGTPKPSSSNSLPRSGNAIQSNQGNLKIQLLRLPGFPGRIEHSAYCHNGRYMIDVPRGRRILDGKSIARLCKKLQSTKSLQGDKVCPDAKPQTPQIIIKGKINGTNFSGRYSMGPCPSGIKTWDIITSAWQPAAKSSTPTSSWQQVILLRPPANQPQPKFLVAPYNDPSWEEKYRGTPPPCVISMPLNPFATCALKIKGSSGIPVYIRMPAAQIQNLIGASPEKVLRLIRQAAIVPPPPGYPGYVDRAPGGFGSIPQNGGTLAK